MSLRRYMGIPSLAASGLLAPKEVGAATQQGYGYISSGGNTRAKGHLSEGVKQAARMLAGWRNNDSTVLVTTHSPPDADAFCSTLLAVLCLGSLGVKARFVLPDPVTPKVQHLLELCPPVEFVSPGDLATGEEAPIPWMLVDLGSPDRLHPETRTVASGAEEVLILDHHPLGPEMPFQASRLHHLAVPRPATAALLKRLKRMMARAGIDPAHVREVFFRLQPWERVLVEEVCARSMFIGGVAVGHIEPALVKEAIQVAGAPHTTWQHPFGQCQEEVRSRLSEAHSPCVLVLVDHRGLVSLRRTEHSPADLDVARIAGSLGGGGHPERASFRLANALELWSGEGGTRSGGPMRSSKSPTQRWIVASLVARRAAKWCGDLHARGSGARTSRSRLSSSSR